MPLRAKRSRRFRAGAAFVLLGLPVVALTSAAVAGGTCGDFTAVAAASGARVAVSSPGFVVVERTEGGAPVAQSSLDSFGTSTAFASYPYPGDEALSVIPLAGLPRSTYPLVAQAQYPSTPDSRVATPAINLTATSTEESASAIADSGTDVGTAQSAAGLIQTSASTKCDDGQVTSIGESTVDGIDLAAGVLRIGRIHSKAKVVQRTGGTPDVSSDLEVSGISIAGQAVGFGPDGITISGVAIPLPNNPLADVLEAQGIGLTYLNAAPDPDGRGTTAPAVELSVTKNVTGGQPTVVTYTFGRVFASIEGAAGAAPPETSPDLPTVPVPTTTPRPSTRPSAVPTSRLPSTGASRPPATATQPSRTTTEGSVPINSTPFSASSIYLVLVIGGVIVLSTGLFFKTVGVRLRWN